MLEKLRVSLGRALRRARPGLSELAINDDAFAGVEAMLDVVSPAFPNGGELPRQCTTDGAGVSPPLEWSDVPASTAALVLIVEDADSPTPEPLVQASVWDLPPGDGGLWEAALSSTGNDGERLAMGLNSSLRPLYLPPDPTPADGPHRYAFQLFALDRKLNFATPPPRPTLVKAMRGHVVARGLLTGIYERD